MGPAYQNSNFYAGQQSYGAQQQSGYRHLQAYDFGAPVATAPDFTSGPDGTFDTRNLRINRTGTIVLWVAFGILFLLACYYLRMFHWYYHIADADDNTSAFVLTHNGGAESVHHSILHFLSNPSLIAGCVCLIASLAYLTMATNNGWYTRCHDGRQFFFARYIDWVVTTPLMLHALAHFANSPDMLSVTGEAITYTVLDLISKGVFGWFIVHASWENPHARLSNRYVVKDQGPNP